MAGWKTFLRHGTAADVGQPLSVVIPTVPSHAQRQLAGLAYLQGDFLLCGSCDTKETRAD